MSRHPNPPSRASRGLTIRQVTVLAAVERLGNPTVPELASDLHAMRPSDVVRVLDVLERKQKVVASGCRFWTYLGDPTGIPQAPQIPAEDVVRYRAI